MNRQAARRIIVRRRKWQTLGLSAVVLVSVILAALVASTAGNGATNQATKATYQFPPKLLAAANKAAKASTNGKKIGGSMELIDHNGGFEADIILSAILPFEKQTGITVYYSGTHNIGSIVESRVRAKNPPDVVNDSTTGNMVRYAKEGLLVPLNKFMNMKTLRQQFPAGVLNAFTFNGKLYGIEAGMHEQMVWYNPKTYKGPRNPTSFSQLINYSNQVISQGGTPWCMGLSAGEVTGFPAIYMIEEIFAKTYGAKALNNWAKGKIPWTSPKVKHAFELFNEIGGNSKMLYGGVTGALATPIAQGPLGAFTNPAHCQLFMWGEYTLGFVQSAVPNIKPVSEINFFPLPGITPKYAKDEQLSGWATYAFNDTPQVRAFMKYWSSAAAQALLASSGNWTVANQKVPLSVYPTALLKKAALDVRNAPQAAFGPFATVSTGVRDAYLKAMIDYMQKPTQATLDAGLANVQKLAKNPSG